MNRNQGNDDIHSLLCEHGRGIFYADEVPLIVKQFGGDAMKYKVRTKKKEGSIEHVSF